ncbi:MAG: carboxypeptidase regulatory-like domain-containing protein [Myxococcales bacterium]|jgi:hypothetical protein|nr:carboxypeptidase regulatory-like domain-containing protein [Myxococcales bacterium]
MSSKLLGFLVCLGSAATIASIACSGSGGSGFGDETGSSGDNGSSGSSGFGGGGGDGGVKPPCVGLQCAQVNCGSGDTTLTGKVYAPNGKLGLYNAIVYVPNAKVDPLPKGAQCDKCGAVSGSPVVTAISEPNGSFTLKNVPVGKDIPLVIQIGKWRRQVVVPEVKQCQETKLDAELTRLPKNQSEGNMPQIALTTGGCDSLGCMLPKVGIDPSEFGKESDGASKAIHVFAGSGGQAGTANPAQNFWGDLNKLKNYDMVILSCECSEQLGNKTAAFPAMTDYLKAGGRIFTTDFMYTWYKKSPDTAFATLGDIKGGAPIGVNPMVIDQGFPKGKALADFMEANYPGSAGKVSCDVVFDNLNSIDSAKAQQWASSGPPHPRVFTVNLPVGVPADQQCGKGVHIDAHVNQGGGGDSVTSSYPVGCGTTLKPAESLLGFFFFDLASCIQKENEPPKPPPVN